MDFKIENEFCCKELGFEPPVPVKPPTKRKKRTWKPPAERKPNKYIEYTTKYNHEYYILNKAKCNKARIVYYHKNKKKVECPRCGKELLNFHLEKHQLKKCCINKYKILNT